MVIRFKSVRQNNIIGLMMIYPDGHPRNVLMAELPMDGDWRADVDFRTSLQKAFAQSTSKLNTIQHMQKHYPSGSAFLLSITT